MKVMIQRAVFRIMQDQVSTLPIPFVPRPIVNIAPYVFDYIVTNNFYVRQKKCKLLAHPRKLVKTIPCIAVNDIVNSDMLHGVVDSIHDKHIHDLAHMLTIVVKYILMVI